MRNLFILSIAFIAASCARTTAGVGLEPRQQFVLGEYANYAYKAKLENRGPQPITVRVVKKGNGPEIESLVLQRKEKRSLEVGPEAEVRLVNNSDQEGQVFVAMNREVQGMRMQNLDGSNIERPEDAVIEDLTGRPEALANAGPAENKVSEIIPPGKRLVVGEGTVAKYSANIRNFGGKNVDVVIRAKENGKRTQSFGLGNQGKVTVYIRPFENITVVNNGGKEVKITVKTSQPVSGARIE